MLAVLCTSALATSPVCAQTLAAENTIPKSTLDTQLVLALPAALQTGMSAGVGASFSRRATADGAAVRASRRRRGPVAGTGEGTGGRGERRTRGPTPPRRSARGGTRRSPPSAGGTIVVEVLGILAERAAEWRREASPTSPDYLHELAEALKHGFADRARFLGDPAFTRVPLEHLLDARYHRELGQRILPDRILAHDAYGTPARRPTEPAHDGGTAHVSVVDKAGNAVALTTTINLEFGARIVAGGIVLNDQVDDFTVLAESCGEPPSFARRAPSREAARSAGEAGRAGRCRGQSQTLPGFPWCRVGEGGLSPSTLSMLRDLHRHALTLASFGRAPRGSARAREGMETHRR